MKWMVKSILIFQVKSNSKLVKSTYFLFAGDCGNYGMVVNNGHDIGNGHDGGSDGDDYSDGKDAIVAMCW